MHDDKHLRLRALKKEYSKISNREYPEKYRASKAEVLEALRNRIQSLQTEI